MMHERQPAVYIMSNKRNGTLYVGVTSDLMQRVYQHKQSQIEGFTKRYGCKQLFYYEQYDDMISAPEKKLSLIENINPTWNDLYETL